MSSELSKQYHSITFGEKNTWDDWHLVPTSRPLFNPPNVKTQYLEVPGADSALDISMSLTGYPTYSNREGDIEFIVMNDYGKWHERYTEIMEYLHGRNMKAILDDDPSYYYFGKFSVNSWVSGEHYSNITIHYNVDPYKWQTSSMDRYWLWDPFNFERDVIGYKLFNDIHIDSTEWVEFEYMKSAIGQAATCPKFIVQSTDGNGIDVKMDNDMIGLHSPEIHLDDGETKVYDFVFGGGGGLKLYMRGKATVSIDFKIGRL